MVRETHRRMAVLAIVAATAASWAVVLGGRGVPLPLPGVSAPAGAQAAPMPRCPFPHGLRGAFESAATETGVPAGLLYAVAKVESNLQVDARSPVGARGLLQLMPATARALALDPDQPRTNILGGARYLSLLLAEFSSVDTALAAYNAGPTAVARAGGSAPSSDVVRYVENVDAVWHSVAGCR